ncbi:uncharacterized protein LOC141725680 isoform X2 [Zonotrichia albicollis]|uniref:uncharacterized protein LOC141725680 isoform X2 n=1 Tax=Zonotrichia albicollis TaxID=44394 RepID=UPI003D811421
MPEKTSQINYTRTWKKSGIRGGTTMTLLAGARHFSSSSFWCSFLGADAPNPLCFWTSMDIFWIARLTIFIVLHQTTSAPDVLQTSCSAFSSCSSPRCLLIFVVSASDTTELIGAMSGSVTFRSHNPDRNVALWSFGSDPIVTVVFRTPPRLIFFEDKFKTRFAVRENGHALSIRRLTMEDAGIYSVNINRKTSTFTLQVFRKLAELTVTCEAQNCSDGSCSCCLRCSTPGDTGSKECFQSISSTLAQPRAESPMQEVNETSQDGLEPVTCTARNPVSSRDIVVTTPRVLCAGAHSGSWIRIGVGVVAGVEAALLLSIFLVSYRKYKFRRDRRRCRVGSLWSRANQLARCEEPNTWMGSKTHTKGAEHVSVKKQILLKTKVQEKLSFLWFGDRSLFGPTPRFLPQLPLPPGVSQCHEQPPNPDWP